MCSSASLRRVELKKRAVFEKRIQQRQQGEYGLLERFIQRQDLPGHLGSDGTRVITLLRLIGICMDSSGGQCSQYPREAPRW
jgi:hypothetical protein